VRDRLRSLGVRPGDRVGICMRKSYRCGSGHLRHFEGRRSLRARGPRCTCGTLTPTSCETAK
jgi:hypothetical protein